MALKTFGSQTLTSKTFGAITLHGIDLVIVDTLNPSGGGIVSDYWKSQNNHPWIHFTKEQQKKLEDIDNDVIYLASDAVTEALEYKTENNEEIQLAMAEKLLREKLSLYGKQWVSIYLQVLIAEMYKKKQEDEDMQIAMLLFEM